MRWPWQPKPGFVRINHKRLIELQRSALRAAELEAKTRDLVGQRQRLEREARARELAPAGATELDLVDLPQNDQGQLHEAAFIALVDAHVWKQREQWLANERNRKRA